jgi:hypothetical protein
MVQCSIHPNHAAQKNMIMVCNPLYLNPSELKMSSYSNSIQSNSRILVIRITVLIIFDLIRTCRRKKDKKIAKIAEMMMINCVLRENLEREKPKIEREAFL